MEEKELQFKNGNPGAAQYGNFINYYQFHAPEERVNRLPKNIWNSEKPCVALDIGCNAGNLTVAIHEFIRKNVTKEVSTLAVDIDPLLIARAKDIKTDHTNSITFQCLDIMDETVREDIISSYLRTKNVKKFSVLFCFSTTMWIHLNYGDEGLKTFLKYIASISEIVVVEPQPWKCYKTAVKRMKQANFVFPAFSDLTIKKNIEEEIENILARSDLDKVTESERTKWERKLLIFKYSRKYCKYVK
ncbi:hypothetical protein JTB14_002699 [Gonioctena quinquepunctata]|nr:hypothetical protein JTB14_002699 [Gonioctena quinquepunctata]